MIVPLRAETLFALLALATAASALAAEERLIPLDTTATRPTATLIIGSQPPVRVIFDSGAAANVLSSKLGGRHDLPNEGSVQISSPGAQKSIPGYLTTLPTARLGETDITGARAVVGDLGASFPGIEGVMSPNMFRGFLVRLELARSRVVVLPKSTATIPAAKPYAYDGAHPLPAIDIDVAGVKMKALLDTGGGRGFALPLEFADRVPLRAPLQETASAKMLGGERKAYQSQINGTVRIGPIVLVDPEVIFIERFQHANVGFSILKDWTVVLDPAEQRSWLVAAEPDPKQELLR